MQDELKAAALRLAAMGLRVFPLKPGSKRPAVDRWPELATTDPAAIDRAWSKGAWNIGVAMGQGWVGLDIDMKRGKDGLATLRALGLELSGFVVATPSGGRHVYYRGPDLGNSADRLGDGLDLRGVHGYLVGPGSVVEGVPYTVLEAGEPQDCPAQIVHRSLAPRERAVDAAPLVPADRTDAVERAEAYLRTAPVAVEGQAGDLTTYQVAARVMDFGVSADMTVDLMAEHWNDRCDPPWSPDELRVKVANAREYRTSPIGVAHPAADFDGVKIEPPPQPERPVSAWLDHGTDPEIDVPWLFYQMLPQSGAGVMVAAPGAGKTFVAIEMARCGATGKPFMGVAPDERFATLFVFGGSEGSGFRNRLAALGEAEPLPISGMVCGDLAERDALTHLLADLKAKAAEVLAIHGVPVRLIVIETLASSGLLQDENSNSEASIAMRNLAHLGRHLGAFVLTSHHPAKDGRGTRGASAIPAAADYVLEIERHATMRQIYLRKARNAEDGRALGAFTLLPVTLGEDKLGRPVTSRVVSTGEPMTESRKSVAHGKTVIDAFAIADPELVEGKEAVEHSALSRAFGEAAGGTYARDSGNRTRVFKKAVEALIELGRVEQILFAGAVYYHLKEAISV